MALLTAPASFVFKTDSTLRETFKISKKLNIGTFSTIRRLTHRSTHEIKALKTIHKKSLRSQKELQILITEVTLLQTLDHPNIIRLHDFFQDSKNFYIITEFCPGGELFDKINFAGPLTETTSSKYLQQILSALVYLHSKKIVHRDIKPENLLLSSQTPESTIKLIDFGNSCEYIPGQILTDKVGTPYYIAPEVLKGQYNEKCDIWSAGVVLYTLLCGFPPFTGDSIEEILTKVLIGKFSFEFPQWKMVSSEAKDLIKKMMNLDWEKRISAKEALEHCWIERKALVRANWVSENNCVVKVFKVFSKIYQILEFHEEKKEEKIAIGLSESFSVSSNSFWDQWPPSAVNQSFCSGKKQESGAYERFLYREKLGIVYKSVAVHTLKGNKHSQLLEFKEKAKQKEAFMQKRKKAAVKIQAAVRGHLQRNKFREAWKKHLEIVQAQHLKLIGQRLKVLFAPYIILKALQNWVKIRRQVKRKLSLFFLNFSATFIQKCWKGFKVRKKFLEVAGSQKKSKEKLRALVQGWKIRKILKCSKILLLRKGVNDLISLKHELEKSSEPSLLTQILSQIPIMRSKLHQEILRLYKNGSYIRSSNYTVSSKTNSVFLTETSIQHISPLKSYEDKPIVSHIPTESFHQEQTNPTFKNFLKRRQNCKYTPKVQIKKKTPEKQEPSDRIPKIPKIPSEFVDEEFEDFVDTEYEESEEKEMKKREFLKRRSKKYEPIKVEWNCKSRVDCWGEGAVSVKKLKKSPKKIKKTDGFKIVLELEKIFNELNKTHRTLAQHFANRLRSTKIPQFTPDSKFIKEFSDDGYQETFEALQISYLNLCNEDEP